MPSPLCPLFQVTRVYEWAEGQQEDPPEGDVGVLVEPLSTSPSTMSWTVKWASGRTGTYSVWPRTELQVGALAVAPHLAVKVHWGLCLLNSSAFQLFASKGRVED